jgi:hypothetical protein
LRLIYEASTPLARLQVQLGVLQARRAAEEKMRAPIGLVRIDAMIADVQARYHAMVRSADTNGSTSAGINTPPQPPAAMHQEQHWSQRMSAHNPRGYTHKQLQDIASLPSLSERQKAELDLMHARREELDRLGPPNDEADYRGLIEKMIRGINAEYVAMLHRSGARTTPVLP